MEYADDGITQTLWIVNTRTCNLDCFYCYQGSHSVIPKGLIKHMPDDVMAKGLEWAVNWTIRGLQMNWYGGEPLLGFEQMKREVPKWADRFRSAKKALKIGITTNGILLGPEVREFLDKYDVGVLLSLDGPKRLHNRSRIYYDNLPGTNTRRGSWDDIDVTGLIKWRPGIEIAWQLDPTIDFEPEDLDELLALGFKNINFNLQWLSDWDPASRIRLERFFKHVGRLCLQKKMQSNWMQKLDKALTVDIKMKQPCGTGLAMLALTPEGYLYPSQEMAFAVFQPGKAPGTAEHYRVGNVHLNPVIDVPRLMDVSQIQTAQMKPPPPYSCDNCVANSVSIGGCHCRYVGQDGMNPANRFEVAIGYCPSMISAVTGLIQAAAIEHYIRPITVMKAPPPPPAKTVVDESRVMMEIAKLNKRLDNLAVIQVVQE